MSVPFSGIVTPMSVAFTSPTGKMFNITNAHPSFQVIRDKIKLLQQAIRDGQAPKAKALHKEISELAEPAKVITRAGKGRVTVDGGVVMFDGEAIHNAVTGRILSGLREGFDMSAYIKFLENLMENPSKRSVDELYTFLERNNMGITDDGHILAYKRIRNDFHDIYTGKFDHSPGKVLEMPRNRVDDNANNTCSYGFHFAAMSYLPHYGAGAGNRIVIVKVNPRDVVSIPADYNAAKARTCRYEVLAEYEGSDKEDILATRAVWATSAWTGQEDDADIEYVEDEDDVWDVEDDDLSDLYEDDEDDLLDDDDDLSDLYEDDEDPIRDGDVLSAHYVYGHDGRIEKIDLVWDDHATTEVTSQNDIVIVEDILRKQALEGRRARVRVTGGDRNPTPRTVEPIKTKGSTVFRINFGDSGDER